MTRDELESFITVWTVKYPYDKRWRERHDIPLFSQQHLSMTLGDILLEELESRMYTRITKDLLGEREREDNVFSLKSRKYIPGENNWLSDSFNSMTSKEEDDLFDKLKF